MQRAIEMVEEQMDNLKVAFSAFGRSPLARDQAELESLLEAHPEIHIGEILGKTSANIQHEDITRMLSSLALQGKVEVKYPTGNVESKTIVWKGGEDE